VRGLQEPQALCGWGAWLDGTANASELSEPSLSRTSLLMLTSLNQNGVWPDNPVHFGVTRTTEPPVERQSLNRHRHWCRTR